MADEVKVDLKKRERELKELDALEKRIRGLTQPDPKMLAAIKERKAELLKV